ncbi:cytochrome P450 [Roseomonas sp. NAR14]|uniref:Cytochrome P450 n=1 Tax=Roseomonas acroporae TaxID=2937791 RepID=A0A9X1YB35_9PROT|nr:cytochrome P450 [Roseomonas acroporae]MCK8785417.1 cytochrome P450 [Roseomonas acroporae]
MADDATIMPAKDAQAGSAASGSAASGSAAPGSVAAGDAPPDLPRIVPPVRPPDGPRLLRTLVRNPIEAWPAEVYEKELVRIATLGRERVFVLSPPLVQQVLLDEADAFVKSEAMLRALRPALGEALLTADGERWRWQRRAVAPVFRPDRLRGFVPAMLAAAGAAAARWRALPDGTEVELTEEMARLTFAIIVETMLSGEGLDGADRIDPARVAAGLKASLDPVGWVVALSLLGAPEWTPYPGRLRARRARRYLRGVLGRLVAARRARAEAGAGAGRDDLLGLLLRARDPETGRALADRDVVDNLVTFVTAGHETTALALCWTLFLLARHPGAEARVLAEIAAVTGGGALLPEHLDRLAYTRQVLQESMRLYPPAAVLTRTADRPVRIGGEAVAPGTPVFVPIYALHRHRALWDDPDRFDPDRFAAAAAAARHRFAYLPFGGGPRLCIGAGFAMLEAVAILATLLPAARLSPPPGFSPALRLRVTLRPAPGLPMRLSRREG